MQIIIIIIIIILLYIFYRTNEYFEIVEEDTDRQYCYLYGCSNIRVNEPKNIIENDQNIPIISYNASNQPELNYSQENYKYTGILENKYYNLKYILYERPFESNTLQDKLIEYKLYSTINSKEIYNLPPRFKIIDGESVWVGYGNLQLGPLILRK
jgi:hypothetical protein